MADIFDTLELEDEKPLELVEDDKEEVDSIKSTLSKIQDELAKKEAKRQDFNKRLTSEIKSFIQEEVSKVQIKQEVVEKIIETRVEPKPIHIEPRIIQAPPAPPQIIKEVRVEVQKEAPKDTRKLVELSAFNDLLVKIAKLEHQLKETRRMAESPIVVGGPGVIGIPPPEGNPEGYVLTVSETKAKWKVATGTGGITPGTFSISNNTPTYSFDATDSTVDSLYQIVATLIRVLQGEI